MAELLDTVIKYAQKGVLAFLLIFIIFFAINLVVGGIVDVIGSLIIRVLPMILIFFAGVTMAISLFLLALYIASVSKIAKSIIENKAPNYINAIRDGINVLKDNSDITIIILILGFVGGILSAIGGGVYTGIGGIAYTGFGVYFGGLFIQGLFYVIATGIALSCLTGKRNSLNFTILFNKINVSSPNAAIVLYILTLLPIIPVIGYLDGILIGIPVLIIILYESHATVIKHEVGNKVVARSKK